MNECIFSVGSEYFLTKLIRCNCRLLMPPGIPYIGPPVHSHVYDRNYKYNYGVINKYNMSFHFDTELVPTILMTVICL